MDGPRVHEREVSSWSGVLVFGSTRSFPGRREQGATAAAAPPSWVRLSFSVSLPWPSGDERGAAGAEALQQRHRALIFTEG